MSYRQYCIFSQEALAKIQGIRGKLCTQAGHAYLHAYFDTAERFPEHSTAYHQSGDSKKITCVMATDAEVRQLNERIREHCGTALIIDSAHTVFDQPTQTCLGIGPLPDELVASLGLNKLKLLT